MRVAIVGLGYVGLVSAAGLATRGHTVSGVDADAFRVDLIRSGGLPFHEPQLAELVGRATRRGRLAFDTDPAAAINGAEVVMLAVGTQGLDGTWQTRAIESALESTVPHLPDRATLVVRSTLPPEFIGRLQAIVRRLREAAGKTPVAVVLNPEFTREGTAVADFLQPERIVVGVVDDPMGDVSHEMRRLYRDFPAPILEMSGADACLAKLGSNLFLATKISFAIEIARLCDRYGARVDRVVEAMALDSRIGGSFLRPGVGFGGSCLPHQVASTVHAFRSEGQALPLLAAVDEVNRGQRDRCVELVERQLGGLSGRRVALLGLAFKPHTDDMRDAPSIPIAASLTAHGAEVVAYDPMPRARACAKSMVPDVEIVESAFDALVGADAAILVTEWPELVELDWSTVPDVMATPLVVDGRNALDDTAFAGGRATYIGFGRGDSGERRVASDQARRASDARDHEPGETVRADVPPGPSLGLPMIAGRSDGS